MRANEFITEQPVTTTNAQGVTTTVNKAANRVTTKDAGGTVVRDRSGNMRSIATPKIGGFQAKQTFRPDATPGYGQATYTTGGKGGDTTVGIKGSPETGYTTSAQYKAGAMDIKATDRYSGQKGMDVSYNVPGKGTLKATSTMSKPGAKPVTKMSLTQSQFEDVQAAIREHVAKRVPFTECMFRPGSAAFTEFYRQVRECADKLNLDWEDQELIATDIGECIMIEGEMVALDVPMIDEGSTPYDDDEEMTPEEEAFVDMVVDYYYGDDDERSSDYDYERMERAYDIAGGDPSDTVGRGNFLHREITQRLGLGEDINEAEYQGRKVKLNSPKRGGSKKFYVYTKNKKGNVIKVSWGDTTGLSVKAKDRGAVKSFVARHKCKEKNDKTKAGYWACRTPRYKSLGVKGGQWW